MKKITNTVALSAVIAALSAMSTPIHAEYSNSEILEKLENMRASVEKKSSATRQPTEKQKENELLRVHIMEIMEDGILRNIADIRDALGLPETTTPQRISGLVKPLVTNGQLVSKVIKRKTFYGIPSAVDGE